MSRQHLTAPSTRRQRFVEGMRVLVVGGIPAGVVVAGLGGRLAMLLLRVTSPDRVRGLTSDDGFTIGRVTLGGTYSLLALGAAVGLVGAVAYLMVKPWLLGPMWFRHLTTGLAAAAVVGSMLVHADGVDFTVLEPTWLAIGLFVVLPGVFGVVIGPWVDAVGRPGSWTSRGRLRWVLPLVALACFPVVIPGVVVVAAALGVWLMVADLALVQRVRRAPLLGLAVRSVWLLIALAGLVVLVSDTRAVTGAT